MIEPRDREDNGLKWWLEAATEGLSDQPAQRIREEVTDHFLSALEHERSSGQEEGVARAAAYDSLGSAAAARKRYVQIYLTEQEAQRLTNPTGIIGYLVIGVAFAGMLYLNSQGFFETSLFGRGALIVLFVAGFAAEVACRNKRHILWITLTMVSLVGLWVFWASISGLGGWVYGILILPMAAREIRIFRKIHHHRGIA